MTTAIRTEAPNHNKLTCYVDYKCRQPECVRRYNDHNNKRIQAKKAGTWDVLVDAEPVRKHILRLQSAGISPWSIAATSGLPVQTVVDFIQPNFAKGRGRRRRTTPATAAKILAVTTENSRPLRAETTATRRRIQALVAIGWPVAIIANRAGLHPVNTNELLRRTHVYTSTADRIEAAYNELRHKRPERNGINRSQASRARNRAARLRWPKPTYWDDPARDINDPHFQPEYKVTRLELIAEEATWLLNGGVSAEDIATRLGVTKGYIEGALRGARQEAA